jgi:hypothetical protein
MKPVKSLFAGAAAFVSLSIFAVPTASAQIFDGVWFKLVAKVQGYSVDPATGVYSKHNFTQKVYLLLESTGGGPVPGTPFDYDITTYTETAPGTWTGQMQDNESTISANENFFSDLNLELPGAGGSYVEIYHTPFIKTKTDGLGALTSAKYKARGEVYFGDDGSGNEIYGDISIRGKSVDVSKLPFVP